VLEERLAMARAFDPIPSWRASEVDVRVITTPPADATVAGIQVPSNGPIPERATQARFEIADIRDMGGVDAGTITAGLFLEDFVDGTPFGHLDICGPMVTDSDDGWRPTGAAAFGTRLLADFATDFRPTRRRDTDR
jgi:leucyl aminopeptidase